MTSSASSAAQWRTHLGARASSISLGDSPLIHRSPNPSGAMTPGVEIKGERTLFASAVTPKLVWRDKHSPYAACMPTHHNAPLRRWLIALGGSTAILLLFLLNGGSSPATLATPLTTYLLPSKLFSSNTCEPYSAYGHLSIDHIDPDGTRWIPFDRASKCEPPAYFRQLRHGQQLDWLRNRTVLIVGDLIDRSHVEEFCALAGREHEIIRSDHPLSPPTTALRASSKPDRIEHRSGPESTLPRICSVPEYGLTLAFVAHYGLDEEDFFASSELYNAPGLFEHRINDVFVPFASRLAKSLGQTGPDLVQFSSGSYDLVRWARQDTDFSRSTEDPLDETRLAWYRFRVGRALSELKKAFPAAKTSWRSLHYPTDQAAELQFFKDRQSKVVEAQTGPVHFAPNRIFQLDQAIRSLLLPSANDPSRTPPHANVHYSPWGSLMLGHQAHSRDRTHVEPGAPGTALWGEMMLYELKRAVTTRMAPALVPRTALMAPTMGALVNGTAA